MEEEIIRKINLLKPTLSYAKNYCEENVYNLILSLKKLFSDDASFRNCDVFYYPTFVISPGKKVLMWYQKAGYGPQGQIAWDYHVILILVIETDKRRLEFVLDFDTLLPFIFSFKDYVKASFILLKDETYEIRRHYRVVDEKNYINYFASDRSHMIMDGKYIVEPPNYSPISNQEYTNNLDKYINFYEQDLFDYKLNQNTQPLSNYKFGVIFRDFPFERLHFHENARASNAIYFNGY